MGMQSLFNKDNQYLLPAFFLTGILLKCWWIKIRKSTFGHLFLTSITCQDMQTPPCDFIVKLIQKNEKLKQHTRCVRFPPKSQYPQCHHVIGRCILPHQHPASILITEWCLSTIQVWSYIFFQSMKGAKWHASMVQALRVELTLSVFFYCYCGF